MYIRQTETKKGIARFLVTITELWIYCHPTVLWSNQWCDIDFPFPRSDIVISPSAQKHSFPLVWESTRITKVLNLRHQLKKDFGHTTFQRLPRFRLKHIRQTFTAKNRNLVLKISGRFHQATKVLTSCWHLKGK